MLWGRFALCSFFLNVVFCVVVGFFELLQLGLQFFD
ncbi:MAG: hypothetical protein ACI9GB_003905, partial [Halioglobus sp.]